MYTLAIYGKYGNLLERRKGDNLDALQRLGKMIVDQGLHGWMTVLEVVIFEGDWWDNRIIWRLRSDKAQRKGDILDFLQRLGEMLVDQGLDEWIPVLKVKTLEGDRIIWRFRSGEAQGPVADTDEGEG